MVLAVLVGATVLFVSEKLRVDLIAVLVLVSLTLIDLVEPRQALAGFSNQAVVTVGAVFVLGGGLARTGVAAALGRVVLRLAGPSEVRLLVLIMGTSAFLSAFMNNVGVAALLLPVVMDIARKTEHPPSRLLIPLTYASLLGGLNTLIGTSPNILVSNTLAELGQPAFRLFDYTSVGICVTVTGIAYMALVGRHLLPKRKVGLEATGQKLEALNQFFDLGERLLIVRLHQDTALAGRTLAQSRIGSALGLSVLGIIRDQETVLAPDGRARLAPGDRLLVGGQTRSLAELRGQAQQVLVAGGLDVERRILTELEMTEVSLPTSSSLIGRTLRGSDFRQRFGLNVLAVWRDGRLQRQDLPNWRLAADDVLVVQGPIAKVEALEGSDELTVTQAKHDELYPLHERLSVARIPAASNLVGIPLAKSRLGDVLGLTVLGIIREDQLLLMPGPTEILCAEDALLLEGGPNDLITLRGLQGLQVDRQASSDLSELVTDEVGLSEVVVSPHSKLVGKSLRDLHFREKYGLSVLALWRQGRAYHSNLQDQALRVGDALLLFGRHETLRVLRGDEDFVILAQDDQQTPRSSKAPIAVALMAGVVGTVISGYLPIYIAAMAGASLMVLTGCLDMEEAYRAVEWRAVFLIAGMLSLGLAMQQTGAAQLLANGVISTIGGLGPRAVLAGVFLLTSLAAQIMPTAAVAVLIAPIAFNTAQSLGLSPQALLMAVAMAASASFMSPVAHPANVMVMGPGGYRFTDYTKVGIPLTVLMFVVVMLVLPLFWPLQG